MARIRTNSVFGTITDNPLTNVATTMNSAGLANLAAVASPHEAIVILDPNRQFGAPEIVRITAHTAAATIATIGRGQFGTTARQHAQGTEWVHGPVASAATRVGDVGDVAIQVFESSGTWTKPPEGSFRGVRVRAIGGGGGGGGAGTNLRAGAGGGGGGYVERIILASALGATVTVTVGGGGAGGVAGNNQGSPGGTSSFGAHCSATGGGGGTSAGQSGQGGAAGAGSGGDINVIGQRGFNSGGTAIQTPGGAGGNSALGGGGVGGHVTADAAGGAGNNYGGGGGGAHRSGSSQAGGAGDGGVVIVETF